MATVGSVRLLAAKTGTTAPTLKSCAHPGQVRILFITNESPFSQARLPLVNEPSKNFDIKARNCWSLDVRRSISHSGLLSYTNGIISEDEFLHFPLSSFAQPAIIFPLLNIGLLRVPLRQTWC